MSERTRSLCSAVKNDVRLAGDGEVLESGCKGVMGRARDKLCLKEKVFDAECDKVA